MFEFLNPFVAAVDAAGARAFAVGGAVRDMILGFKPKDIDVEVFGLNFEQLCSVLRRFGSIKTFGQSFGVIQCDAFPNTDFCLPRRERKNGENHTDFEVTVDPFMSLEEAASRRDFTINAIMFNLITLQFFDPFNGRKDLHNHVLRHTSNRFIEDPLRVLRGVQLASRFDLNVHPDTLNLFKSIKDEFRFISTERAWGEIWKWANSPSSVIGLMILEDSGWIDNFPELKALVGCKQDQRWHAEGDVWMHTMMVVAAARFVTDDPIVILAALFHDIGKPATTVIDGERITAHGHEKVGAGMLKDTILAAAPNDVQNAVKTLVATHMGLAHGQEVTKRAIMRLKRKLEADGATFKQWRDLVKADRAGRIPKHADNSDLEFAETVVVLPQNTIKPLVTGHDLINMGFKAGPDFKKMLEDALDAQAEGFSREQCLQFAIDLRDERSE